MVLRIQTILILNLNPAPGTVLGSGDRLVSKAGSFPFNELEVYWWDQTKLTGNYDVGLFFPFGRK